MISVAEQFSNLRNTLGSILGIFTLLRWFRTLLAKVTGRPPPADATSLTPSAFAAFQGLTAPPSVDSSNAPPTPSKKPFVIFLLAVFGLPYLMSRLIRSLASQQESQQQAAIEGIPSSDPSLAQPIDPSKLVFCRVLYDYTPPNPSAVEGIDLPVKKGDIVAILSKLDPERGEESEWWKCRNRAGGVGYLPGVYLEEIQRRPKEIDQGRANTITDSSRANSLNLNLAKEKEKEKVEAGNPTKWGVEEFQNGGFYS